jgi:DNA ligase (NAD+)
MINKIKELTKELLQYCHEYYDLDAPTISDAEYDKKFDALKKMEDEANFWLANSPTRKVQGEVLPYLTKVRHSVPMLSADKSTNIEDVVKFIGNKDVIVTYKFDGGTCVVKYRDGQLIQGLSRGSGYDGEDITHTVRMIKNLPLTIPYKGYLEIRGEALIPWKAYNEMNVDGTLGHPRNVCAGALRQLNANEASKRNIHFYAFTLVNWREVGVKTKAQSLSFMNDCGFDISPYCICSPFALTTELQVQLAVKDLNRENYHLPTDGWVFEFNDLEYGESLGSTGHHDRRLYALKPAIEAYETTLRDVEWTLGKTGQLTPTAIFDPTEIDNTIVTKASVHNLSVMKNLGLKIGGKCSIHKANMIIPQVLSCEGGEIDIIPPSKCPVCGGETAIVKENESEVLVCPNPNCSGMLLGRLKFFVSKPAMNIDGLSEATLDFFIDKGWVKSFKDIYHLAAYKDEWQRYDGFGKKSVEKILDAIEKSRNIDLANFICALSIDGIGTSASKTIANAFNGSFDAFFYALMTNYDWSKLHDFGTVTARNIADFGAENADEVYALAQEMRFVQRDNKVATENPMNGKKFCITGSFSQSRDLLKQKLEELGAVFVSSVSKNLDILFCGEKAGSKLTKAQSLGVKVAYEEELMKIIN